MLVNLTFKKNQVDKVFNCFLFGHLIFEAQKFVKMLLTFKKYLVCPFCNLKDLTKLPWQNGLKVRYSLFELLFQQLKAFVFVENLELFLMEESKFLELIFKLGRIEHLWWQTLSIDVFEHILKQNDEWLSHHFFTKLQELWNLSVQKFKAWETVGVIGLLDESIYR